MKFDLHSDLANPITIENLIVGTRSSNRSNALSGGKWQNTKYGYAFGRQAKPTPL